MTIYECSTSSVSTFLQFKQLLTNFLFTIVIYLYTYLHIFTIMQYVFVYGTLKKGQPNHYLLENEENGKKIFCGKALSKKKFPLIVACRYNIPYVLDAAGQGKVIEGEIYKYVYQNQNF